MPGFIHGFIHYSKHGTSAISNHPRSTPVDDGAYLAVSISKGKVGCS